MADVTRKELEVLLRLRDDMTTELRRVESQIRQVDSRTQRTARTFRQGFKRMESAVGRVRKVLRGLLNPLTLIGGAAGVGAITALARSMSQAAADAEELNSKFRILAGDRSGDLLQWMDELAERVKRSRFEIQAMTADTIPFLDRMLGSRDAAIDASQALTQLAIDVGSFYNVADQEVIQRFRSALVGSGEALDVFGARIGAAELAGEAFRRGITETERELTEQEKGVTRLLVLFDRFPSALGDAERTAGSFTNQMKELRAVVTDARIEFGERLNRAILDGLDQAGGVAKIRGLIDTFFAAVAELSRIGISVATNLAQSAVAVIDQLGGPDAFIRELQLRADALIAKFSVVGAEFRQVILQMVAGLEKAAELMRMIGFGDSRSIQDLLDERRALQEELTRSADAWEAIRIKNQIAELDKVLKKKVEIAWAEHQVAEAREQAAAATQKLAAAEAQGPLAGPPRPSGGPIFTAPKLPSGVGLFGPVPPGAGDSSSTAASLAAAAERAKAAFGGGGAGISGGGAGATGAAVAFGSAIESSVSAVAERASAVLGGLNERVQAFTARVQEFTQKRDQFAGRQVTALADSFLQVATGASKAGDAIKNFFRVFISDLLRLQTIAAFNQLFGGAFRAAFTGVNQSLFFNQGGMVPSNPPSKIKGFAAGGGIAATDTVPAMLTPGEFVMSKGAVDRIGAGRLADMNAGRRGSDGAQPVTVNFQVQAVDARSVTDLLAQDGKGLARVIGYAIARDRNLKAQIRGAV